MAWKLYVKTTEINSKTPSAQNFKTDDLKKIFKKIESMVDALKTTPSVRLNYFMISELPDITEL